MSCSRKKKTKPPKKGHYQCQACGQVRKNESKLCKAKRIKDLDKAVELQLKNEKKRGRASSAAVALAAFALMSDAACHEVAPDLAGQIAFTRRNSAGHSELWRIDANGRNEKRLFSNADPTNANVLFPKWVDDRIEVVAMKDGRWALWSITTDGSDARVDPGEVDDRLLSRQTRVPDLEVRSGEVFRTDGTRLFSWRLHDGKLNPGASEASWSPDKNHALFQTCAGSSCKIRVARADGKRAWTLTRGRQPAWSPQKNR